jgi:hypothetical protein
MVSYFRSNPGRMLALAMALPLIVGAIVPFNADGVGYYALPLIVAISLGVVAVGLGLEDYPGATLTGIIGLPVALFLYVLLVGVVVPQLHSVVYAMAISGCALLVIAARPNAPAAPTLERQATRTA